MRKIKRKSAPVDAPVAPAASAPNIGAGVKSVGFKIEVFRADGTLRTVQTGKTVQEMR